MTHGVWRKTSLSSFGTVNKSKISSWYSPTDLKDFWRGIGSKSSKMAFFFRSLGDGRGGRYFPGCKGFNKRLFTDSGMGSSRMFLPHHGESTSRLAFLPIAAQCIHPWCRMGIRNHLLPLKCEFRLPPDVYGWVYVTIYSRLNGNFDCCQTLRMDIRNHYFCLNGNFNCRQTFKLDRESPMTPLPGAHLSFMVTTAKA